LTLPLWRLYRAEYGPGLDGIGGTFADGRWHTRGERVVYFGATAAIVVLERLAHTDPDLFPADLRLASFEFMETISNVISSIRAEDISPLPENWVRDENATRRIGGQWWRERSSPLLLVPSAILPEESNYLLNAQHPGAKSLQLIRERPFTFDPRLI
jgi:RES domain-containing protein